MTDLEKAKNALAGNTLVLCKSGELLISDKKGISPIIDFIGAGKDLSGYCAADIIVGKATALMFAKCGIKSVYAKVLSQSGKEMLEKFGIEYSFGSLTEKILNRTGDGTCPMEQATIDTEDPDEAYELIKKKLTELRGK